MIESSKASIDALLQNKVSVEVAPYKFWLRSPTVEKHQKLVDATEEYRESIKDLPQEERDRKNSIFNTLILVKTCLDDEYDITVVDEILNRLGEKAQPLISRCYILYRSSRSLQLMSSQEEGKKDLTDEEFAESAKEDRAVPFS